MGPSKAPNRAEREYMAAAQQCGCVVECGLMGAEPYPDDTCIHHITDGKRLGHFFTIPLRPRYHTLSAYSVHGRDRAQFLADYPEWSLLELSWKRTGLNMPENVAQWIRHQRAMRAGV